MGAGRPWKGQNARSGEQIGVYKPSKNCTHSAQFKLPTPKPEEKKEEPKK